MTTGKIRFFIRRLKRRLRKSAEIFKVGDKRFALIPLKTVSDTVNIYEELEKLGFEIVTEPHVLKSFVATHSLPHDGVLCVPRTLWQFGKGHAALCTLWSIDFHFPQQVITDKNWDIAPLSDYRLLVEA